jgi:hypothetical protein
MSGVGEAGLNSCKLCLASQIFLNLGELSVCFVAQHFAHTMTGPQTPARPRFDELHPVSPQGIRRLPRAALSPAPLSAIRELQEEEESTVETKCAAPSPHQPRYRPKPAWLSLEVIEDD